MRKDLVQIVCCPVHKTPLKLTVAKKDEHEDILEGTLRCADCRFDYPIEEGIPNLLPPEYHLDEVKAKKAGGTLPEGKVAKDGSAKRKPTADGAAPADKPKKAKAKGAK